MRRKDEIIGSGLTYEQLAAQIELLELSNRSLLRSVEKYKRLAKSRLHKIKKGQERILQLIAQNDEAQQRALAEARVSSMRHDAGE